MDVFFTHGPHGRVSRLTTISCGYGYSLVEVLVVLAVIAILGSLAIPSMGRLLESNRITSEINRFSAALALTRSEAIKRNQHVVMCKSQNGTDCLKTGRWDHGWLIFVDDDHDRQHDDDEAAILFSPSLEHGIRIDYRGFGSSNYITYRPTGFTKTTGTFTFCMNNATESARALILMTTGRVRFSSTKSSGAELICPD